MLTGIPYGRLVSEAIRVWYAQLQKNKTWRLSEDHAFRLTKVETV